MQTDTQESLTARWGNKSESFASTLHESHAQIADTQTITQDRIESAVSDLVEQAISMSSFDWEKESPCPHCGGDFIERIFEASQKVIHYEDGGSKSSGMHLSTESNGFRCYDCDSWIRISPKALLMGHVDEYDLSEHEVLQQALTAHTDHTYPHTDGEYERGEMCSDCTRRDIVETQIYSETIIPCGDCVDNQGDFQPVSLVSIRCDGCGHRRSVEPIATIPMTL